MGLRGSYLLAPRSIVPLLVPFDLLVLAHSYEGQLTYEGNNDKMIFCLVLDTQLLSRVQSQYHACQSANEEYGGDGSHNVASILMAMLQLISDLGF